MIEYIELRNWKTHENTRLDFTKGTNVLIGQMGSGKSSVMDAISYALFGTFPALKSGKIKTIDLIKNTPKQEEYAEIKLGLRLEGDEYTIERRIELSGSAYAKIAKNGSYVQSQPQRVNEYIKDLLKVDYDLFSRAIYSEQNNLDYFLQLRSGERKDQIDKLLGLDRFAIAEDNATSLINKIKDIAEDLEKAAGNFDIGKLEAQLNDARQTLEKLRKEGDELSSKRDSMLNKVRSLEAELKDLQSKNSRRLQIEKELKSLESRLELIEREAKKIEEMKIKPDELEKEINYKSKELEGLRAKLKDVEGLEMESNRGSARLESEIKRIEEEIKERDSLLEGVGGKSIEMFKKKKEEKEQEITKLEKEIASSRAKKEEVEKYIDDLSKHISKCPVCERELSEELRLKLLEEKKDLLKKASEEIEKNAKLIEASRKELQKLSDELNSLLIADEKLKKYVGLDEKLSKAKEELKALNEKSYMHKKEREELSKNADELSAMIVGLKEKRKEVEKLNAYKKEEVELSEKIESYKKELDKISREVGDEILEAKQKEFTEANSILSSLLANLSSNQAQIKEKEEEIREKEDMLQKVENLLKDAEAKKKAAEELTKFKNALSETQGLLRAKLINSINHIMSEIWPELYPYGDYVDIRLNASSEDYILEVKVLKNGSEEWKEVESIASGGERSIACLAMRVAFALVLVPNLKWIILDEPTHNIDEQGISKFIHVFNETLPNIVDQIFLITHDEALKQASSSKTYMLKRDKASHGSTVVEEL